MPRPPQFISRRLSGVRIRLSILVLLAVLPAFGLIIYSGLARRDQDAARAREQALEVTRRIAERQAGTQEDTRQLLSLLSKLPALNDSGLCNALLTSLAADIPHYRTIGVTDAQGNVFCSSIVLAQPLNVADRGYFQEAAAQHQFTQSYFQISRVDGQPSVAYAYPWLGPDGSGRGVVLASLDLAWLSSSLSEIALPQDSVVTLFDKDGVVLARSPADEALVGLSQHDSALFSRLQAGAGETLDATGLDDVRRMYAFTRVGNGENSAYLTLGIPRDVVFAAANEGLRRNLTLLGTTAVLALLVAWVFGDLLFVRRIKALVRESRAIAGGDLDARTGVSEWDGELGELSIAFNEMAGSLQARQIAAAAAAEELRRSNSELEQFAYVASHDLQEPLRMISSYTQLLARRYQGRLDADADDFIGFAVEGAGRMQQLINDLLEFSRVGRKSQVLNLVSMDSVAATVLLNLRASINESGANVEYGPLPSVTGDEVQLTQLLQNLIGNAIKFRGEDTPDIQVSAEQSEGSWTFSVSDNGIGIDPAYQDRIFVIFQRLHTRDRYEGNGIGLALCRRIVGRHGGIIWVESSAGAGATFSFTLRAVGTETGASPLIPSFEAA